MSLIAAVDEPHEIALRSVCPTPGYPLHIVGSHPSDREPPTL